MRVVFAGTPEFAKIVLDGLLEAGHDIRLVLTQPDRPSGRGLKLLASPVKRRSITAGIEVLQPSTLKDEAARPRIIESKPDVIVVAAYGLILPPWFLAAAAAGAINVHASVLPRWRGAAPIQRAILAGDAETGVTIMQMDTGLDTGPMLAVRREAISSTDDFGTVHDRLAKLGTELLVDTLDQVAAGALAAEPQPEAGATYARKIDRSELEVDWNRDAEEIACAVRAFRPAPGLGASVGGRRFKIWAGEVVERMQADAPGDILLADRTGIVVACGRAAYRITELQRSGGRRMKVHEYLRGQPHGPASHGEIVPDAGD